MKRQARLGEMRVLLAAVVGAVGAAGPVRALVYSPRITSEHVADCSSLEAFRRYPAWKDKTGHDLALAAWLHFVGTETGVFHYNPIQEGLDPVMWEFRLVRDPIKMLNVYGYGFCGLFGPTTAGLFDGLGFEARSVGIPAASHNVTEVWYDGGWRYYDTDLRGVLFERDSKTIASVKDVIDDPTLWTDPAKKIAPFFPEDRDLSVYARSYREKDPEYTYHWFMGGSTMDYVLRKGETFTRWWRPQGGRWAHNQEDAPNDFWRSLIEKEPRGAKGNHPAFSIWTHGNGLFEYAPNLRAGSRDFQDGLFHATNVALTDRGLEPAGVGAAEVIWEVLSPYVIVPLVGKLDDASDDKEASVVQFRSTGPVTVALSLDYGRSWKPAKQVGQAGETTLDLTPHLRGGRYQYLVKFSLAGQDSVLESLKIKTWVQVAPISLPRLKQGANHLRYDLLDKRGLATVPWMQIPNMGDKAEMARWWAAEPKDYDPKRTTSRLRGEGELVFAAPPGRSIRWMSLGGFFNAHQGDQAPKTANEIWYRVEDAPATRPASASQRAAQTAAATQPPASEWKRAYRADVPTWHTHWHYAYDTEVMLDKPAKAVRVKYVGDPGVNGIRVNIHCLRPAEKSDAKVVVTHGFKMDGQLVEKTFTFDKPTDYTIECPSAPEDVFVRLTVPGDSR